MRASATAEIQPFEPANQRRPVAPPMMAQTRNMASPSEKVFPGGTIVWQQSTTIRMRIPRRSILDGVTTISIDRPRVP